jgi:hypothetical protein
MFDVYPPISTGTPVETTTGNELGQFVDLVGVPLDGKYAEEHTIVPSEGYADLVNAYGGEAIGNFTSIQRTIPTGFWNDVAYSDYVGLYVAVTGYNVSGSTSNFCATSPDGITWTQRTMPVSARWWSVVYGGGLFLAVASHNSALVAANICATSPDGITWTQRTLSASIVWTGCAYGNGMFVVSGGGSVLSTTFSTSYDGVTWTSRTVPSAYWTGVTHNGSIFCAISGGAASTVAATSPDGITWTARTLPVSTTWSSIAWNGSVFCAVAGLSVATTYAAVSPDGVNWTLVTLPTSAKWYNITWNGDFFCLVGDQAVMLYSPDGINWQSADLPVSQLWFGIGTGPQGIVVAVGNGGVNVQSTAAASIVRTIGNVQVDKNPKQFIRVR